MLSIFPALLTYKLVAPLILRLALGVIFLNFGWTKLKRQKNDKAAFFDTIGLKPGIVYVWVIALIEILTGLFLIVGFLTQIAALVAAVILIIATILKKKYPSSLESSKSFLILALIVAVSLLFTGAGFYSISLGSFNLPLSFDLPL
jgi:putative oxidoreductase